MFVFYQVFSWIWELYIYIYIYNALRVRTGAYASVQNWASCFLGFRVKSVKTKLDPCFFSLQSIQLPSLSLCPLEKKIKTFSLSTISGGPLIFGGGFSLSTTIRRRILQGWWSRSHRWTHRHWYPQTSPLACPSTSRTKPRWLAPPPVVHLC